jgi:Chemotaxis signal transduction protein
VSTQLVVFALGDQEYGVDVSEVNGILRSKKFSIQILPGTPKVLEGMIDLRGQVSYIFNLRTQLGLAQKEISKESKFIMLNANKSTVGFIVDEVTDIVKLEAANLQPAPDFVTCGNAKYIKGIGKIADRLITILDSEKILSVEEYSSIQGLEEN